ncbi:hypothetical protein FB446DRAFT_709464 [Lentinula raphanica]|nr:hypothetical protein FB446DRAFT_709464 [Lentinula raphanica]
MSYLTLPYPEKIPPFPQILKKDLDTFFMEHQKLWNDSSPEVTILTWRIKCHDICLQEHWKLNTILNWLAQATYLDAHILGEIQHVDALNVFLSIFILKSYKYEELAVDELFPVRQRNFVSDLINQVEEELYEADLDPILSNVGAQLGQGASYYQKQCLTWAHLLQKYLLNENESSSFAFKPTEKTVSLAIKKMKEISASVYKTQAFIDAVVNSGLSAVILRLSDPAYGYKYAHDPHHAQLLRLFGFGLVLGELLDKWEPKEWTLRAENYIHQNPVPKFQTINTKKIKTGKDLFQKIFALLGINGCLGLWMLQDLMNCINYLKSQRSNPKNWAGMIQSWDSKLLLIIEETFQLRDLLQEIDNYAHDFEVKHCTKCLYKPQEKKCISKVAVKLNQDPMFISQWTGIGISKVPEKERMLPHMSQKSSLKDCKIVHPDEVGLEGPHGDFARLVKYSQSCTGVQPIHRGGKFAYWSSGQMIPFGARQPSGGRRADHYTFYAGIEANTHEGIKILFEQAQISAIMIRTAKAIHPALVTEIQENSKDCEKVGVFGQSLFHCTGYTAPQHAQYVVNKLSYGYEEVPQEAQDVILLQDNVIAIEQREYNKHAEDITHVKQLGIIGN